MARGKMPTRPCVWRWSGVSLLEALTSWRTAFARQIPGLNSLYERLREAGFDRKYARAVLLPSWWEDEFADDPSMLTMAKYTVAKVLGISIRVLDASDAPLGLAPTHAVRLKKHANAPVGSLFPGMTIGRRAAELVNRCLQMSPLSRLQGTSALMLRAEILAERGVIDLGAVVEASWRCGVPVISLLRRPHGRMDGMATMMDGRPVAILSSASNAPAHVMWHLAHELGHIACGHVESGDIVDLDFGLDDTDQQEVDANTYAAELLFGKSNVGVYSRHRVSGAKLAEAALARGREWQVAPGAVVANYAYTMQGRGRNCWGSAQVALKILEETSGARELVRSHLASRVTLDELGDEERDFLMAVTGLSNSPG